MIVLIVALIDKYIDSEFLAKSQPSSFQTTTANEKIIVSNKPKPEADTLYIDMTNDAVMIFFTNDLEHRYFDNATRKEVSSPYMGVIKKLDGSTQKPFYFFDLKNPRKIVLENQMKIQDVNSIKLDTTNNFLYISVNLEKQTTALYPHNLINTIYQINIKTLATRNVWSNDIGSNKYPGKGAAYIETIADDKYLAMQLGNCYACEGHTPIKALVLNILSGAEKYLENAGNIQFNLLAETFTYQIYLPYTLPCVAGPGCNNGVRTHYKPAGDMYTQTLPSFNNILTPTPFPSPLPTGSPSESRTFETTEVKLTYPANVILENRGDDLAIFDHQIYYSPHDRDPADCRGDCEVRSSSTNKIIGSYTFRVVNGYIGSIGGNVPQKFVSYELNNNGKFYIFQVRELKDYDHSGPYRTMGDVPAQEVQLLETMLATLVMK